MDSDLRDLKRMFEPQPPWWMVGPGKSDDWMLWSLAQ